MRYLITLSIICIILNSLVILYLFCNRVPKLYLMVFSANILSFIINIIAILSMSTTSL